MGDLFPGYVIDTSALIDLWRRHYPRDIFPSLWERLEKQIGAGELIKPQEVINELEQQHDELLAWAKKRKFAKELKGEQISWVSRVLAVFPDLVDEKKAATDADPFVVALAGAKGWKVVTSEKRGEKGKRRKIPDACDHYDIKCLSLVDFFRDKDWNF